MPTKDKQQYNIIQRNINIKYANHKILNYFTNQQKVGLRKFKKLEKEVKMALRTMKRYLISLITRECILKLY